MTNKTDMLYVQCLFTPESTKPSEDGYDVYMHYQTNDSSTAEIQYKCDSLYIDTSTTTRE